MPPARLVEISSNLGITKRLRGQGTYFSAYQAFFHNVWNLLISGKLVCCFFPVQENFSPVERRREYLKRAE